MTHGFDRLERFFTSRRKASREASPKARSKSPLTPPTLNLDHQFPSPSFMRPTTSRMTARQEVSRMSTRQEVVGRMSARQDVGFRQAAYRSPSVPDMHSTPRAVHGNAFVSVSADGHYQPNHRLARMASYSNDETETLMSALHGFQFPKPPTTRPIPGWAQSPPTAIQQGAHTPRLLRSHGRSLEISIPPSYPLATPPSSDAGDHGSDLYSPKAKGPGGPLMSSGIRLPTPGQSPDMPSTHGSLLRTRIPANRPDNALFPVMDDGLGGPYGERCLDKTYSQSSKTPSDLSFGSSTLREPELDEFFSLTDDDIAECIVPDSPVLAPVDKASPTVSEDLWIASSEPLTSRLLTLAPPRASSPAKAAAFEAARIARRYDFDLVYVVNLWPHKTNRPVTPARKPMMGRLLAAHGLDGVPCPLEISEEVHTTILRSEGWVEYRDQDALDHDMARGFACAFHTGQFAPSNSSSRRTSPVSGVRLTEWIDRGIVFAAYRKPRPGQAKLGRTFKDTELGQLHREAEALVEMVLDIHAANKQRERPCRNFSADDLGPVPTMNVQVA
ncbi:hypothetical protein E4U31_004923 [Claviceps sp. LM219 group G6]|nr:hypothetical protein E4U31_004923 [Claviceps sp. LM219 group G6]